MSDPEMIFDDVRRGRHAVTATFGPLPTTLADALPNRTFWFKEDGRTIELAFSQALVVGHIVRVTKGPAFVHEGDDELRGVEFDDPAAAERAIEVHVRVSEFFGPDGSELPRAM